MRKDFAIKYLTALELIERPQGATIKELQNALECGSERTVYRVLATLDDKGVPIYSELDVYGPTNQKRSRAGC
jgi:predicted DNA-binding transcriptional regulator YafY